jgi:diguanylate cyclase (GGDEF)-like protein
MKNYEIKNRPPLINSLLRILRSPSTWHPLKNRWLFIGFFWGIPVPVVILWLGLWFKQYSFSLENISTLINENPFLWLFCVHPILFAIVFGVYGAIRNQVNRTTNILLEKLSDEAHKDTLTELVNRRHFKESFERERSRLEREDKHMSLMFFDIDHFKSVNDSCGHLVGDQILKNIARILEASCRKYDVISRWGGDEFLILLPGDDLEFAYRFSQRVRQKIKRYCHKVDSFEIHCTISVGLTSCLAQESLDVCIKRADKALYRSKSRGRDRVSLIYPREKKRNSNNSLVLHYE